MNEKIDVYIDGRSYTGNGSGFAVILISRKNKWLRSFAYGKLSVNQADLAALKFALLSINSNIKYDISIFTKNDYIVNIFKKVDGKYTQIPSSNTDIIDEIKKIIEFKNTTVVKMMTGDLTDMCKNMAVDAIKIGKLIDIRK